MAFFSKKSKIRVSDPVDAGDAVPEGELSASLSDNLTVIKELFGESFDLVVKHSEVCSVRIAFVALDGMYNGLHASQAVVEPAVETEAQLASGAAVYEHICSFRASECDSKDALTIAEAVNYILSGCMVLFVDGEAKCRAFSVQGFPRRPVQQPDSEAQENGSREGFADMYKDNVTLVRRRLKSPYVRFEVLTVGATGNNPVVVCYHSQRADMQIVERVKECLSSAELDFVCGAGALRPFLEKRRLSFFSAVGSTERPDVFSAKLAEGRVGIIADGTPHALVVPYLFAENFHTLDDYLNRPYYATVTRILKIICFLLAVFLPGTYVAVGTFHQEIFPSTVLSDVVASLMNTPFPLAVECLIIHFIYEIVREAGLRMPGVVGHTVSIVGALVIGDAAVSANLISAPMLIIVALTAICSAVVPSLHQPTSVLRLIFIILGGAMGLYGIMLGFSFVLTDICSKESFGVPFSAPLSPLDTYAARDTVLFAGWRNAGRRVFLINKLKGRSQNENKG